jgi:dihydrofolate reductase
MFGPIRGPWPDSNWKGWWGDNPPISAVFVLTHTRVAPRDGRRYDVFISSPAAFHEALDLARKAANGKDVRIGGGVNTIQQYLRAGLIDELHVATSAGLLGRGERYVRGGDMRGLGYECVQFAASEKATHTVLGAGALDRGTQREPLNGTTVVHMAKR